MTIKIFDSMARDVVPLETREEGKVAMYCCGPTVYNYIHIGNARTMLWFEFIRRYLDYRGYDVTYVMNYTDVDDKIIERAKVEKIPPEGITQKYTRAFEEDLAAMGAGTPDIVSKATDHIGDMVAAIEGLVDKGIAYESDGNVWYSVEAFDGYGKLSGRTLEDMRAGERVEPMPGKRHPLDFSLWKTAKEGEPSWDSPWGPGRPGWHIECSVMSTKYLGMDFDVHGGGTDLIFPHHENEIAQAEGLLGGEFVRHWMHAGMVQMGSEKMSKSIGNVVLAHDAVERFGGAGTSLLGAVRFVPVAGCLLRVGNRRFDRGPRAVVDVPNLRTPLPGDRHAGCSRPSEASDRRVDPGGRREPSSSAGSSSRWMTISTQRAPSPPSTILSGTQIADSKGLTQVIPRRGRDSSI